MNRKLVAIVVLLVLMLSVCMFAAAEEATDPVYPGQTETHVHDVQIKIIDRGYSAHLLHEWCPGCGRLLKERLEGHSFEEGVCTVCDWGCPHPPEAAVKYTERDGVRPQWDGNYIICPGWEITECGICHTVLSRVETIVREFHNHHTHFTPVLECVPHDSSTHALIRFCDDCGTEVPEYAAHNCPASDAPYKDDGDLDTHVRYVKCDDCGDMIPQRQAHKWVHDAYTEFDGMGDYHNEVMHCTVCGAIKQVPRKHEWKLISCDADENGKTHTRSYECTVCGDCKEIVASHELVHHAGINDGNTESHIEVLECTECGQIVEGERVAHKPTHLYWTSVSDTQDQETVICNLCGLTYQQAPTAHQFDAKSYDSNGYDWETNSGSHSVFPVCSKCGAHDPNVRPITEQHSFTAHRYCDKCLQAEGHTGSHNAHWDPVGWVSINENQHAPLMICNYLDYKNRRLCNAIFIHNGGFGDHTYDLITMKCTYCGYLKEGCEHSFEYVLDEFQRNENEHFYFGTCTKCGKTRSYSEKHNMVQKSATKYVTDDEGHSRTVVCSCTICGYENAYEEKDGHQFVYSKQYSNKSSEEHRVTTKSVCAVCGYVSEVSEVDERHTIAENTEYFLDHGNGYHFHYFKWSCKVCGLFGYQYLPDEPHVFVNGKCQKCFAFEPENNAYLPEGSVMPGSEIAETAIRPVMTVNGVSVPVMEMTMLLDGGQGFDLFLCPETDPAAGVIELHFSKEDLEINQKLGIKDIYLRLNDTDLLLLNDIGQTLTILSEREAGELLITLTPGSEGEYTVQYDPAGVYIME